MHITGVCRKPMLPTSKYCCSDELDYTGDIAHIALQLYYVYLSVFIYPKRKVPQHLLAFVLCYTTAARWVTSAS